MSGPDVISGHAYDLGGGQYGAQYTPTVMGVYVLRISLQGQLSSALNVSVSAGSVYPQKCTATGSGLVSSVAGVYTEVTMVLRDKYGNLITSAPANGANFAASITDSSGNIMTSAQGVAVGVRIPLGIRL